MATDTTVNNLIINKLTKAQYDAIASPSDTELYLVPDGIPVVTQTASSVSINPNCLNQWGEIASLTITLATPSDATIVNEYMIEFTSGSTATTLSMPSSVEWAESCGSLSVEASKTYQISIVNNIGLWTAISNS